MMENYILKFLNRPRPKDGEARTITKFLWIPKKINNEWRWLGVESYRQLYAKEYFFASHDDSPVRWHDINWIN